MVLIIIDDYPGRLRSPPIIDYLCLFKPDTRLFFVNTMCVLR